MLEVVDRHPHARSILTAAVPPAGAPSHAYLFHGPAGAGKRDAARAFAAELLAEGVPDPANARRRATEGVHPDLTWVRPSGAAEMLVGDIEEPVVGAATRTPFEARRRVFVIEAADTMNDQAANKMLKTLEEPPPFAHLVLLTDKPGNILPTIASRCQLVRFEAATPAQLSERLQTKHGVAPLTADACARLALGDASRALSLALPTVPPCATRPRSTRARACTPRWAHAAGRRSSTRRARAAMRRPAASRPGSHKTPSCCPTARPGGCARRARRPPSARTAGRMPRRSTTRCSSPRCGCATSRSSRTAPGTLSIMSIVPTRSAATPRSARRRRGACARRSRWSRRRGRR